MFQELPWTPEISHRRPNTLLHTTTFSTNTVSHAVLEHAQPLPIYIRTVSEALLR